MKKIFLLLTLVICVFAGKVAFAATEHEPNNTPAQANNLTLNGSITGAMSPAADIDYYKVTTTSDGMLSATLTLNASIYTWVAMYDNNGTTLFLSNYSNTTVTINQDGLAAGTYYLAVYCYYGTDTVHSYTLSNTLTPASVANDVEPDNSKAQAEKLNLNSTTTGHVGYYYNLVRDTNDWYKVTTNADGYLRLKLTPNSGQYVWVYLYDNDGVTLLNSAYANLAFSYNSDGLAAGTYYIRVNCYYTSGFSPYSLTDSLYKPAQANDLEPNNNPSQAVTFTQGSTVTGHIGYYYNHKRDTADWYKLTTNADGLIGLTITSTNGTYIYAALYDNNGTTLIHQDYSNTTGSINTDGLGQGTYYVKVYCFYNSQFSPYTLTNTLTTYTNANDVEPNNSPYQAKTMPANGTTTGHFDFYYNGAYDPQDWWKINYTANDGNLTVTRTLETQKLNGSIPYTWMYIYKDTTAAPIYSMYNNTTTLTASLTGLTQGYYWVKIIPFYSGATQFDGYNITNSFKQTAAKITLQSTTNGSSCTNGAIQFKCSKSEPPYIVQLYRYELPFGSLLIVKNTKAFTFSNLPPGLYHATAFGDGATGTAFGKTTDTAIVPIPANTSTTGIKKTQVTLKWDSLACIKYYSIQYRVNGTGTWTTVNTTSNKGSYVLKNLTASTTYNWQVASVDTGNKKTAASLYAAGPNFTTTATREALSSAISASVYPNPASTSITITLSGESGNVIIAILNLTGQVVQQQTIGSDATSLQMDVSKLPGAMYMVKITDSNGSETLPFEKQ
jgi:Secretion system C-terminal sorting domain/Fibronectin type III domain